MYTGAAHARWYDRAMETVGPDTEISERSDRERLWAPWRMNYIGNQKSPAGCIFCTRLTAGDDRASLILHRGQHAFVIMNLYPYNTGHVMIVPNAHAADLAQVDDATLTEMALMLPRVTRALRRALGCHGFNIGLNIGAVAGAGVADHLHQHVVPRWTGDANFMPILAGTTVMPEMIPVTYAKLRAELARELAGVHETGPFRIAHVVRSVSKGDILVVPHDDAWELPRTVVDREDDVPVWRVALNEFDQGQGLLDLVGIAAGPSAGLGSPVALVHEARPGFAAGRGRMLSVDEARALLPASDISFVTIGAD